MKNKQRIKDLTGQKFGRLTVVGLADTNTRKTFWVCQCDCGNFKTVRSDSLQNGRIKSCGCLKLEQDKKNLNSTSAKKKFLQTGAKVGGTRLYGIWVGMKGRCYNEHDARYERYGRRGISVCEEWKESFEAFHNWAILNGYNDNLTIDRIDNNGNYSPENCRWATQKEQSRNRSTNINITIGNSTRTLTEWCEIFELDSKLVFARYKRNGFIGIDELLNKG